uniref:TFIIS N-terminal domain-containing protein n=1 Tax=Quercus lobata TaxID=97700 RepID=A0A7N2RE56_QUELO
MGFQDDPFRDEDGEPLMDFDDVQSDREQSPEPRGQDLLDDDDEENWQQRERSETPVYDEASLKTGKPRKRLVKKSGDTAKEIVAPSLIDEDEDEDDGLGLRNLVGEEEDDDFERKRKKGKESSGKKEKRHSKGGERRGFSSSSSSGKGKGGGDSKRGFSSGKSGKDHDGEVKEMWDTIAGGDSEDDQEGSRTMDDDNFIDDTGVEPADGYGSGNEPRSPGEAPQAEEGEEDDEIKELFKMGKKRKKNERSPAEIALLVENVMAELEVTAEEDADLNRQAKPAVNKLKKLPLLTEVLSKKQLQQEFLDHGVLTLLKNWLEPLPDGSLPNINIRAAILRILTDFPIDLEQYDRREQLKKSGLGKVIMFLSKSDEETTSNRKLAKDLVDKWSRPIFNKSTRFEEMRNVDDERVPYRRPPVKKPANKAAGMESRDGDLGLDEFSRERKSGQSSSRLHATRPEATPLDFVVRPQSKIDPDEIRARAKQVVQDQRRLKFWLDRWCGTSPLADHYPDLYRICCNKEASVADLMRFTNGVLHWDFQFCREVHNHELEAFRSFINSIYCTPVRGTGEDKSCWLPCKSKGFMVSAYYHLLVGHVKLLTIFSFIARLLRSCGIWFLGYLEFAGLCHSLLLGFWLVGKVVFAAIVMEMNKKLQQLKAPKKKQLQATKLSVEGRGMVKYL